LQTNTPNIDAIVLEKVIRHGKPYTHLPKPKYLRWRKQKQCFYNSWMTAVKNPELLYVEGFILGTHDPIHHAWVSPDGIHAIDVTLRRDRGGYYGIGMPAGDASKLMMRGRCLRPALHDWSPT
jgi:hypothetical protein